MKKLLKYATDFIYLVAYIINILITLYLCYFLLIIASSLLLDYPKYDFTTDFVLRIFIGMLVSVIITILFAIICLLFVKVTMYVRKKIGEYVRRNNW